LLIRKAIRLKKYYLQTRSSKFVQDSFWALLGNILAKGLSLLGAIIVARILGKETFGEFGTIKSTLMNVAIFSTFGLGYTATKFIAENKKKNIHYLNIINYYSSKISFAVSAVMAIILFLTSDYVADVILEAPHLAKHLKIVSVWVVFSSITTAQIGVLAGFGAYKPMAKINAYVGILGFVSSIVLTYYWNLTGALLALLVTQILNWYLNHKEVKKYLPKVNEIRKDISFLKKMLKFSFPVTLQEALYSIISWLMILVLIRLTNYGQVGLYSAALQWSVVILFIPSILRNVVLSHMSETLDDQKDHDRVLKKTLVINFIATLLPFIIIYTFKNHLVNIYGSSFKGELENVLTISLLSTIFMSLSNVYAQAYMSRGKNWLMLAIRSIRDLGILFLTIYLIKIQASSGAIGLAKSILLMNVIFLMIMAYVYHTTFKKKAIFKFF